MKSAPTFPPLLKGHRVLEGKSPVKQASAMLAKGAVGAGDLLWSENQNRLQLALVLEPEVSRAHCAEMLFLVMVALGDAVGALSAPEIAITYRWPGDILVNDALVGCVELRIAECEPEAVPDWMIASLDIAIRPERGAAEPGENADLTTLWDEGCGTLNRTDLLESASRHIVNWIHTWDEEGFKPVHEQWMGRLNEKTKLATGVADGQETKEFLGLDEAGNALVRFGDNTEMLDTLEAVAGVRGRGQG